MTKTTLEEPDCSLSNAKSEEQAHNPNQSISQYKSADSLEALYIASHLSLLNQRLEAIEVRLKSKDSDPSTTKNMWIEVVKIAFGGWPIFGLIFMFLFYAPIRDAINVIPEKVRTAEEIGVMGVSLKTSIKVEAQKIGAIQLSETLPNLSPMAVEYLLRSKPEQNSLVYHSLDTADANLISALYVPSEKTLTILSELESKELISISLGHDKKDISVEALRKTISDVKNQYKLSKDKFVPEGSDGERYTFPNPTSIEPPYFAWYLTELGKNAVAIILKAVSAQLTPQHATESGNR